MAIGQGVAQAFEDAVHLAHAIQEGGLTPQSLRAFEAKRVSRLQEIMAAEMVSPCMHFSFKPSLQTRRVFGVPSRDHVLAVQLLVKFSS